MSYVIYKSQCARDAQQSSYGGRSYWDYLESHSIELHNKFLQQGDKEQAERMLTRDLGEALQGNKGQ